MSTVHHHLYMCMRLNSASVLGHLEKKNKLAFYHKTMFIIDSVKEDGRTTGLQYVTPTRKS